MICWNIDKNVEIPLSKKKKKKKALRNEFFLRQYVQCCILKEKFILRHNSYHRSYFAPQKFQKKFEMNNFFFLHIKFIRSIQVFRVSYLCAI